MHLAARTVLATLERRDGRDRHVRRRLMRGLVRWAIWVGAIITAPVTAGAAEMIGQPPARPSLTVCATHGDAAGITEIAKGPVVGATVVLVAPDGTASTAITGGDGCIDFVGLGAGPY